jgi:hypothetical protein
MISAESSLGMIVSFSLEITKFSKYRPGFILMIPPG